jgi:hypothetical protein
MLHALRDRRGHSRTDFVDRCGAIVSCSGRCLDDVGGPVTRDIHAPRVDMSALAVSVDLEPRTVSLSAGTRGCVTVVVAARNTTEGPVWVQLEGPAVIADQTFGWRLEGYRSGATSVGGSLSLMQFNAGETRRHVFECANAGWNGPGPGTYVMTGYVRSASDSLRLTIVH